jgi:hypothetical protein
MLPPLEVDRGPWWLMSASDVPRAPGGERCETWGCGLESCLLAPATAARLDVKVAHFSSAAVMAVKLNAPVQVDRMVKAKFL